MNKQNLAIRILLLFIGIFVMSVGVALSIRSNLGAPPGSSVPYVSSLMAPFLTVGTATIMLNVLFVILQVIILNKEFKAYYLLQIPIVILLGWFIDISFAATTGILPASYWKQWVWLLLSCVFIAFGIFLQVKSNIAYLPAEGFTMAISKRFNKDFGKTKILIDSMMIAVAAILSLVFLGGLFGVREGTLVSIPIVGFVVNFYKKTLTFIDKIVFTEVETKVLRDPYMITDNFVITINRQFGSGGHAIGEIIAKKLNIAFYDSKLIDLTAEEGGFTKEYVKKNEQKISNNLLYTLYKQNYAYVNEAIPPQDMLFMIQTKVIREIAAKESCVIVGRSADYILKGHPNCFNVFVHANKSFRIDRIVSDYGIAPEEAEKEMERKDRERINYSKHYTGHDWDALQAYDLTVESSLFGIDITAAMIIDARRKAIYFPDRTKKGNF